MSCQYADDGVPCREPKQNLSDNLLRDFEQGWWTACREVCYFHIACASLPGGLISWSCHMLSRSSLQLAASHLRSTTAALLRGVSAAQGDVEKIRKLLSTSAYVLANTVDENRRRSAPPPSLRECPTCSKRTRLGFALV